MESAPHLPHIPLSTPPHSTTPAPPPPPLTGLVHPGDAETRETKEQDGNEGEEQVNVLGLHRGSVTVNTRLHRHRACDLDPACLLPPRPPPGPLLRSSGLQHFLPVTSWSPLDHTLQSFGKAVKNCGSALRCLAMTRHYHLRVISCENSSDFDSKV